MVKTLLLCAGPGALIAWSWLRLGKPHAPAGTAVWVVVLAVLPAVLPRLRWRLLALAATAVLALHSALDVWAVHPLRLLGHFGRGFLEFYDSRLPFAAATHPRMEGVLLVAVFVGTAAVALAVAARRPVAAAAVVLVAVGWPATLLTGPDDLGRGVALLAVALSLLVGLAHDLRPRRLLLSPAAAGVVVLVAVAASTSSAVASGQVLHWQDWDFYTKPAKPVGVEYVWNSNYRGVDFPKKVTPVLRIKAGPRRTYWRATTLDEFMGGNWYENAPEPALTAIRIDGRDELVADPELPRAGRDPTRWVRQDVTVLGLRDNHLIGASVPVAFEPGSKVVDYAIGGVAYLQDEPLSRGDRYSVWSYQPRPRPSQLAALPARYPAIVKAADLFVAPRVPAAPPFGAPNRERRLDQLFADSYVAREYRPMYERARRAIGEPANPYAAALELEGWFRSGAFSYDEHPPQDPSLPPLAAFVLKTRSGYCQHFAGAMALLLRYFGIPARVAAGFTSGTYDKQTHEWTVTDHDAHTWVEAWFPRYGWLPFDPTPGRSLDGSYTASSPHFDLSDGLSAVAGTLKRPGTFDLRELRKLRGAAKRSAQSDAQAAKKQTDSSGAGVGALLQALLLVVAAALALVAVVKIVLRKRRYLTRDPRRLAAACVRELADFVADQGARAPPSASLRELARLVEDELGVSARAFVTAAAEARFGPAAGAHEAARNAREELRALRRDLRAALTRTERAFGLVSLRSLGLAG